MKMLTPRRLPVSEYETMLCFGMRWQDDTSNYLEKLIFAHIFFNFLRNRKVLLLPYSLQIAFDTKPLARTIHSTFLYHV